MKLKLTKKCTLDLNKSIVSFKMSTLEFAHQILNDLFILQREAFNVFSFLVFDILLIHIVSMEKHIL